MIKYILVWLFIFIVGSLIVSFLIYPSSFESFKENIKNIVQKIEIENSKLYEDKCSIKFNECKEIAETKIGNPIEVHKIKKFEQSESIEAKEFFESWCEYCDYELDVFKEGWALTKPIERKYPLTMFAYTKTITNIYGAEQRLTLVSVCDAEEKLLGYKPKC